MAKSTTAKQKFIILERYINRSDWTFFSQDEYDTVDQAMKDIDEVVRQDPEYYADMEYKIAAINDDTIRLKKCVTCNLEIHKD